MSNFREEKIRISQGQGNFQPDAGPFPGSGLYSDLPLMHFHDLLGNGSFPSERYRA